MQSGRKAAETVKETAANAAVSAEAGMEKAKATTKEKAERLMSSDPADKEAATIEKEQRRAEAELNKAEAKAYNHAVRGLAEAGGPHPGYETWASTEGYTTTAKATDYPPQDKTTSATGHYTTAATDPRYPPGPTTAATDPHYPPGPTDGTYR